MTTETAFYSDATYAAAPDDMLFDTGEWPVAFLRFPELDEENRLERVLAGFDAMINRNEPFALVIRLASHDHDDEPHEAEKRSNIWMKRRREAFGTYCKAIIYVTPDPALQEEMRAKLPRFAKAVSVKTLRVAGERSEGERVARELLALGV